jgi:hypothetical protein
LTSNQNINKSAKDATQVHREYTRDKSKDKRFDDLKLEESLGKRIFQMLPLIYVPS